MAYSSSLPREGTTIRRPRLLGTGLLLILGSATAGAQDTGLSVPQLTSRAAFIGIATVTASDVRQNATNGMVYTHYALKIVEAWKGTPLQPAELLQGGGELDGKISIVAGHDYKLVPGQTIVLFATISKFGNYVVIGLRQGLFEIGAGPDFPVHCLAKPRETGRSAPAPGLTLAGLKKEVFGVLGLPYEPPVLPAPAPGKVPAPEKSSGKTGDAPEDAPQPPAPHPRIPEDPHGPNWAMIASGAVVAAAVVWLLLSKKRRRSPGD